MPDGFAFVDEVVPGVRWDAKYATADNFLGRPVDGYLVDRVLGTSAMCAALAHAQARAETLGLGLLLWDGYRPRRAVEDFVRWAAEPEDGRTKARHYPNIDRTAMFALGYLAAESSHCRGSTIDLTLCRRETGAPVPMGGDYDLMDPVSHHGATGIAPHETQNRRRLRAIMTACGFSAYDREWWHYTLDDEPFPGTSFDFPVEEPGQDGRGLRARS